MLKIKSPDQKTYVRDKSPDQNTFVRDKDSWQRQNSKKKKLDLQRSFTVFHQTEVVLF